MAEHKKTYSERTDEELENLAFFPIKNPEIEHWYQKQKEAFWTAQHIDYTNDRNDWNSLDTNTKHYIKHLLFLFAQLDGIVNENLVENFEKETSVFAKECSMFYAVQKMMEWTHNETYSLLIKTFIQDTKEQEIGLNSIKNFPAIRAIADWAFSKMDSEIPLLERIVAFACIEGVIFSSAFAGIYWIKRRNILHALTKANEWIARDEGIHFNFGITLYHQITSVWKKSERLSQEKIYSIIGDAVAVTERFTRDAMNVHLVGLDADDMMQYVRCTADNLIKGLNYTPLYNAPNPYDWMLLISIPNKTNYFESRVTEYSTSTGGGIEWDKVDTQEF